jgi:hypothetical protein
MSLIIQKCPPSIKKLFAGLFTSFALLIVFALSLVALVIHQAFVKFGGWQNILHGNLQEYESLFADLLGPLTGLLAIVAFVDVRRLGKKIKAILEEISTRHIGDFPDNLAQITKLIKDARYHVDLLWDAADPGSYFDPQAHEDLVHALEQAAHRKVEVRFLVWGPPQAVSKAGGQNNEGLDPIKVKAFCEFSTKQVGFRKGLPRFLAKLNVKRQLGSDEHDVDTASQFLTSIQALIETCDTGKSVGEQTPEFKTLQLCYHEWVVERLRDEGVEVFVNNETTMSPIPANFFWIMDDGENTRRRNVGGFALVCPGIKAPTFRTHDSKLIDTFNNIFTNSIAAMVSRKSKESSASQVGK